MTNAPTAVLFVVTIPVIAGAICFALWALVKFGQFQREREHDERMRALELGTGLPQDEPWWSPARISVAIGAGVPIGVFVAAWLASASASSETAVIPLWISAGIVGVAGVICGTVLACQHFAHREAAAARAALVRKNAKPVFDHDAFDVVGSRGHS